jgi:hypothetical protein
MTIAVDINDVLREYTKQFITMYKKVIDPTFDIEYEDVDDFTVLNVFPFLDADGNPSMDLYYKFKYEDCPLELHSHANITDPMLSANFELWQQTTLRNFDEDKLPNLMIVSPFEMTTSIQATLEFLSKRMFRVREIYFPIDSMTIWDRCDILITANPTLLENKPEGKISFKINTPYNKDVKGDYEFNSMMEVIQDTNDTLVKIIEGKTTEE